MTSKAKTIENIMQYSFILILLLTTLTLTISCNEDEETTCTETTWFQDSDDDGLGDPLVSQDACEQPTGYVANDNDPDDNSCTTSTWYQDADGDGLGNPLVSLDACSQPEGYVANANDNDDTGNNSCTNSANVPPVDQDRGECTEGLAFTNSVSVTTTGALRIITANNIPDHMVGLFGNVPGSLNPNAISAQSSSYEISLNPTANASFVSLLGTGAGPNGGPQYSFGVLLNGVELDPIAAEPWPHTGAMGPNVNWEWNLEALNVQIGLDCNSAHVQPNGKYHYHGKPTLYLDDLNTSSTEMTLIGYAADGFPIYYKYAYSNASDNGSAIKAMTSSYQLKAGERPGDGDTAPCGGYTGVYSNDYEFVNGLGTLDEANGRTGVTPEYPGGTYYYVLTDEFPSIPRYLRGTPSQDFKIGM